jgi:hypothetical protein
MLRMSLASAFVAAACACAWSASAGAQTRSESSDAASSASQKRRLPVSIDVAAGTLVPISMGPELSLELPGRVLLMGHLGWMPEMYSDTLTNVLEDAGAYDDTVGRLIDGGFESATTWRIAAGWRPFARLGLEFWAGYAHVSLAGNTTITELLPIVSSTLAARLDNEVVPDSRIDLNSSIDHFTVAIGWRWLVAEHVLIRANLGYMQSFASDSSVAIENYPQESRLAEPYVDGILHDHYMRYIKLPVVGLSAGYRFF